jgi:hypothetical protein
MLIAETLKNSKAKREFPDRRLHTLLEDRNSHEVFVLNNWIATVATRLNASMELLAWQNRSWRFASLPAGANPASANVRVTTL